ncbi:hypothetical protein DFJ77DRAFT_449861 [Powellomyces hirtus]|nr:hypothetical protein DFJ77DRAFT_449861 [Powellomyces hirtus]
MSANRGASGIDTDLLDGHHPIDEILDAAAGDQNDPSQREQQHQHQQQQQQQQGHVYWGGAGGGGYPTATADTWPHHLPAAHQHQQIPSQAYYNQQQPHLHQPSVPSRGGQQAQQQQQPHSHDYAPAGYAGYEHGCTVSEPNSSASHNPTQPAFYTSDAAQPPYRTANNHAPPFPDHQHHQYQHQQPPPPPPQQYQQQPGDHPPRNLNATITTVLSLLDAEHHRQHKHHIHQIDYMHHMGLPTHPETPPTSDDLTEWRLSALRDHATHIHIATSRLRAATDARTQIMNERLARSYERQQIETVRRDTSIEGRATRRGMVFHRPDRANRSTPAAPSSSEPVAPSSSSESLLLDNLNPTSAASLTTTPRRGASRSSVSAGHPSTSSHRRKSENERGVGHEEPEGQ